MKLSHCPITLKAAQSFVTDHHRHNRAPRGARYSVAALWAGEVVGVVMVGRPVSRMLDDGSTVEVLRCCVRDGAPRNTPSFLYGAARRVWQAWGGRRVLTYTLETGPGDSLRGAGFLAVARTKSEPKGWGRKSRTRKDDAIYAARKTRWQADCAA